MQFCDIAIFKEINNLSKYNANNLVKKKNTNHITATFARIKDFSAGLRG